MEKSQYHQSRIQKYFHDHSTIILNPTYPIANFLHKYELVYLAEILHSYFTLSSKDLFKLYYLLLQMVIQSDFNSSELSNLMKQHNFKNIVINMLGRTLISPERILLNRIAAFLDCSKINSSSNIDLINSLINQYHEYRLIDNFKEVSREVRTICKIITQFINNTLCKEIEKFWSIEWNKMGWKDFQVFYQELNQIRVINIRIQHLHCQYMTINKIQILSREQRDKIEQKYQWFESKQKETPILSIYTEMPQKVPQRSQNNPPVNVRKNLKSIGNALRSMSIAKKV